MEKVTKQVKQSHLNRGSGGPQEDGEAGKGGASGWGLGERVVGGGEGAMSLNFGESVTQQGRAVNVTPGRLVSDTFVSFPFSSPIC